MDGKGFVGGIALIGFSHLGWMSVQSVLFQ
jgi:hypothetical protein